MAENRLAGRTLGTNRLSGGGSDLPKEPAGSDPTRQLASELARAQAAISKIDPKKGRILGDLLAKYGSDIPPEELARAGLKPQDTRSLGTQIKQGGLGLLGRVASVLSRPQQTVYGLIKPEKGQGRLSSAWRGLSGQSEYRTLSEMLDKKAPESGRLLGLRRGLFKTFDFIGGAATDPTTYVTFGTGAAAKQGISTTARTIGREGGEQLGREAAETVAKRGLKTLPAEQRSLIEAAIRAEATPQSAARTIKSIESGASRIRFAGKDIPGLRGLPVRGRVADELVGQAGVGAKAAAAEQAAQRLDDAAAQVADAKAARATAKQATKESKEILADARKLVEQAKGIRGAAGQAQRARSLAFQELKQARAAEKAALADLKAAKSAAKDIRSVVNAERNFAANAAEEAAKKHRRSIGIGPRRALRDTAERATFTQAAATVSGQTARDVSNAAFRVSEAAKAAGITHGAETALVQEIKTAIEHEARSLAAGSGSLSRGLSQKQAVKIFEGLAASNPQHAQVIEALTPRGGLNLDRVAEFKRLDDVFEHGVARPIRSTAQPKLTEAAYRAGLDPIRRDVGGAIDEYVKTRIAPVDQALNPPALSKAMSLYRRTAIRTPGFFVRNTVTDYLSSATAILGQKYGATEAAKAVPLAWKAARTALKKAPSEWDQAGAEVAGLLKRASDNGVIASDVFQTEARGAIDQTRRRFSPLKAFDKIAAAGARTSEHARLLLFATSEAQGMSAAKAADVVRKTLGDYSDYSYFERTVMRQHVAPFYKFHRFNTPFQLAQMVLNPKVAAAEFRAQQTFANGEPTLGALPVRLAQSLSLPLGGGKFLDTNTGLQAALQAATPAVQLGASATQLIPGADRIDALRQLSGGPEGPELAGRTALSFLGGPGVGGIAKELAQQTMATDFYSGRPITERDRMAHLVQSFLPEVARVERLTSSSRDSYLRIALSMMAGITTIDVNDSKQVAEVYRRLDLVRKLVNDAETDGQSEGWMKDFLAQIGLTDLPEADLPTLTELRDQGVLPDPNAGSGGSSSPGRNRLAR